MSDHATSCWLCDRPLGDRLEWHHPIPKVRKGKVTVPVHPICHRTIHANFTNAELGRMGDDVEALLAREPIRRFIEWVADKPPDFHAPTRRKR